MGYLIIFLSFVFMCSFAAAQGQKPPVADTEKQFEVVASTQVQNTNKNVIKEEEIEEEPAQQEQTPQQAKKPAAEKKVKQHSKGRIHKVWIWQESGDCLWNLAKKYYGDPWLWKEIYLANQDEIDDPRVIYPKQELIIPDVDEIK